MVNKINDYINRQEAIEALDAVPYDGTGADEHSVGEYFRAKKDKAAIENVPSIDVEPVVRCKDCIFGHKCIDVENGIITAIWVECRNPDGLHRNVPCGGYCHTGIKNTEQEMDGKQNDRKTDKIDK